MLTPLLHVLLLPAPPNTAAASSTAARYHLPVPKPNAASQRHHPAAAIFQGHFIVVYLFYSLKRQGVLNSALFLRI
jgi:hypothetical protein